MSLPLCRRVSTSVNESPPTQTSLPFRRQDGYTLHIHTADRVGGYNLHVHTAFGVKEYSAHLHWYTLHVHTADKGNGFYTLHVYSAGSGKGIHPAQPHCMQWKEKHLYKGKMDTLSCLNCLLWKGIQPLVHNVSGGKRYILTLIFLTIWKGDTLPPCPYPAGGGKRYILMTTVDCGNENTFASTPCW